MGACHVPQVAEIEEAEKEKMRKKCKKIIEHGVNVFINRQLIYNFPEQVQLSHDPLVPVLDLSTMPCAHQPSQRKCRWGH